jgi:hypothetical protein
MDRAFKLRSKLLTDKGTYRIPFKESALTHYGRHRTLRFHGERWSQLQQRISTILLRNLVS